MTPPDSVAELHSLENEIESERIMTSIHSYTHLTTSGHVAVISLHTAVAAGGPDSWHATSEERRVAKLLTIFTT